ncbi:TRAP transporter substrate-binding protein DctP [Streptomyces sp. DSM 42041]|uniref:TRAP transporter substrate-binding protein DctP n=1 Tax=Streptomyces hazeniae TaxID=3075538 RepID=A0ABU2NZN9_9ACTN|nr:TRAP transporter substrate-binding protein DctP [Streptomyces sp. DSM 42041]MDT0381093.1 TRAP transporter substrate-binding protein DctP [Streptomyces sp. DSM 42041]
MQRFRLLRSLTVAACCLAAAACGTTKAAPDGETLVIADLYSPTHSISEAGIQPFMKEVREASDGRIDFDYRSSEQLVAAEDNHWALRAGAADAGNILYMDSQMSLMYVPQLPGLFTDREVVGASRAFWEFVQTNPQIQADFREWNMRPLFCFTTTNYQMQFSDRSVSGLSGIEGKQVRAAGSILPHTIEATGAVSTDINAAEAYDAFNRGVVEGLSLSVTSMRDYSFYELIESAVIGLDLGGFPVCYAISSERWNQLSDEEQRVLRKAGEQSVVASATTLRDQVEAEIDQWRRDGIDVHVADRTPGFEKHLDQVEDSWVDQLVGDGADRKTVEGAIAQWKRLLAKHTGK